MQLRAERQASVSAWGHCLDRRQMLALTPQAWPGEARQQRGQRKAAAATAAPAPAGGAFSSSPTCSAGGR